MPGVTPWTGFVCGVPVGKAAGGKPTPGVVGTPGVTPSTGLVSGVPAGVAGFVSGVPEGVGVEGKPRPAGTGVPGVMPGLEPIPCVSKPEVARGELPGVGTGVLCPGVSRGEVTPGAGCGEFWPGLKRGPVAAGLPGPIPGVFCPEVVRGEICATWTPAEAGRAIATARTAWPWAFRRGVGRPGSGVKASTVASTS
jgi:hypothetical protein